MSTGGSQQLRLYRRARRDGATVATACVASGISMSEARLIEVEDAKSPPPPEAYELLYDPAAQTAPPPEKDQTMATQPTDQPRRGRGKKQDEPKVEEVQQPDFERAVRVLKGDIGPAEEKNAKSRGDLSAAWKVIEDECHVNKKAAKDVNRLAGMSEELRDDYLRSFYGMMQQMGLGISRDLVDQMGDGDAPTMPVAERTAPTLHTVN